MTMTARAAACIEISELSLWYGDFSALKNVTLEVPDGEITALIGPSGCGKTTLLRCLNRINERYGNVRTTGKVLITGKNIYDDDVSLIELRKTVGMVFQRPNPLPISIYNNVLFGHRLHVSPRETSRTDRDALVEAALAKSGCGRQSRTSCTTGPLGSRWSNSRNSVSLGCSP